MALPENIQYLYDTTGTAYGAVTGSSLRYVLKNGLSSVFNNFSNIEQCYTFRYTSIYSPGVHCCLGKKLALEQALFTNLVTDLDFGSIGVIFCSGGGVQQGFYQATQRVFYNSATEKKILTGETTSLNVNQNVAPNAKIITGQFDLSHYFFVPRVTARKPETNLTITQDWKTYIAQYAADYPHITQIIGTIYYKQDLAGTSTGQSTNIELCGSRRFYNNVNFRCDSSQKTNNYEWTIQTENLAAFGNLIYKPPTITERYNQVIGISPPIYLTSMQMLSGFDSTHSPDIQKVAYQNPSGGAPGNTPRYPYIYVEQATARKIIESIGLWIADSQADIADAHGADTTSDNIFMPHIDSSGSPTGDGYKGTAIGLNWETQQNEFPTGGGVDSIGSVPIDLKKPVDKTSQTNTKPISFNDPDLMPETPTINGLGVFANYYALSVNGVLSLSDFLWNADESIIDDVINSLKLFGQNPINAIMSLRLYPFNVADLLPSVVSEEIILGRVETGVYGLKIPNDAGTTIDLGTLYIGEKYGDFRDYSPYTSYNLYIPFIGTVNLNPNDYLNRVVGIKMVVDITTGKATAIIYAGDSVDTGIPMQYLDGMIGVEIPITGENMGQTANAVINAVGSTASAALTGGGIGAAMAAVSGAADIVFNDVSITKTGNVSPAACLSMPIKAYLVISRPTAIIPANYGHSKGYACDMTATLSTLTGFTACYNVDTSSIAGATDAERSEIKSLLEGGIFI